MSKLQTMKIPADYVVRIVFLNVNIFIAQLLEEEEVKGLNTRKYLGEMKTEMEKRTDYVSPCKLHLFNTSLY